jgi:hypothetical protein
MWWQLTKTKNRYRLRSREAVRDPSTSFAMLTSLRMTEKKRRSPSVILSAAHQAERSAAELTSLRGAFLKDQRGAISAVAVAFALAVLAAGIARAQFKGTDQRPVSQRVFRTGGPEIKGSRFVGPVYQASMATNLMANYGGL